MQISTLPYVLTWLGQVALWVIYADDAGVRELIIGSIGAAVSTFFVWLFLSRTRERFTLQRNQLVQAVHIPSVLARDTWILLSAIARKLRGKKLNSAIVGVHFNIGGDDSVSRGRRALAISYFTLTPNTLVLGILRDKQLLFFHTVIPQPLPAFMMHMGATPGRS